MYATLAFKRCYDEIECSRAAREGGDAYNRSVQVSSAYGSRYVERAPRLRNRLRPNDGDDGERTRRDANGQLIVESFTPGG